MATDGIQTLISEHRKVDGLFESFQKAQGNQKEQLVIAHHVIKELSVHSAIEEQVLYPLMRKKLKNGNTIADESLKEHAEAKKVLYDIDQMTAEDPQLQTKFQTLIKDIREHVKEEEEVRFPELRSTMTSDELAQLAQQLENHRKFAPTRPHPSAPDQPPANIMANMGAAAVDKARDMARGTTEPQAK